jgi:hypothetical protein
VVSADGSSSSEPSAREIAEGRLNEVISSIMGIAEDRFGGVWLGSEPESRDVFVAVVDPTQGEIDRIEELTRGAGWIATCRAVRYSERQLEEFADGLVPLMRGAEHWIATGPRPELNQVEVQLTMADPALVRTLTGTIPGDALTVTIVPGEGFEPLLETQPRPQGAR